MKNNYKFFIGVIVGIVISASCVLAVNSLNGTDVKYDNTNSGLNSSNIQNVVEEIYDKAKTGTAEAGNILEGKTALINGTEITGTMVNNGGISKSLGFGGSYTIPAGYHDGTGIVTASSPSGTLNISSNGTYNVTNYSNATVNVSIGGETYKAKVLFNYALPSAEGVTVDCDFDPIYVLAGRSANGGNTAASQWADWVDGQTYQPGSNKMTATTSYIAVSGRQVRVNISQQKGVYISYIILGR